MCVTVYGNFVADYSNIDAQFQLIIYVGTTAFLLIENTSWYLLNNASPMFFSAVGPTAFLAAAGGTNALLGWGNAPAQFSGAATALINNQLAGDLEGGDPANTLKITAYYAVLDL